MWHHSGCGNDLCLAGGPSSGLSIAVSLSPFVATFAVAAVVSATRVFPRLSEAQAQARPGPRTRPRAVNDAVDAKDGTRRGQKRRPAAAAFGITVGLATVLAELILAEVSDLVDATIRNAALRITISTLLFLVIVLIPFLEVRSLIAGAGWSFRRTAGGRVPRVPWALHAAVFGTWLLVFWSLGRFVPVPGDSEAHPQGAASFASGDTAYRHNSGAQGLVRSCLDRVGVIGISLMALLSGFASVSSPWQTFAASRIYRRRPATDADIARKEAGLAATRELLLATHNRLQSLQMRSSTASASASTEARQAGPAGFLDKLVGSIRGVGATSDEAESLGVEMSGLEVMEANLASSLALLRTTKASDAQAGTVTGMLLGRTFAAYCVYRVLATVLITVRRLFRPAASFSASDPVNRLLGLIAKHWDPTLDQTAWSRQMSFLLSGVILAASAGSVRQTFHIFAKWTPAGLLRQAHVSLALFVGQVAATYVISAALLLRSSLPREVGSAVSDALESSLEPGFVDRWFETWFLLASAATAGGIWAGQKLGSPPDDGLDEWDDLEIEKTEQKRH